jgi:hypothetical protein
VFNGAFCILYLVVCIHCQVKMLYPTAKRHAARGIRRYNAKTRILASSGVSDGAVVPHRVVHELVPVGTEMCLAKFHWAMARSHRASHLRHSYGVQVCEVT